MFLPFTSGKRCTAGTRDNESPLGVSTTKNVLACSFRFIKTELFRYIVTYRTYTFTMECKCTYTLLCHTPHNAQLLLQEIQQHTANCIPYRRSPVGSPLTCGAAAVVVDMYCCLLPVPNTPAHIQETVKGNPLR